MKVAKAWKWTCEGCGGHFKAGWPHHCPGTSALVGLAKYQVEWWPMSTLKGGQPEVILKPATPGAPYSSLPAGHFGAHGGSGGGCPLWMHHHCDFKCQAAAYPSITILGQVYTHGHPPEMECDDDCPVMIITSIFGSQIAGKKQPYVPLGDAKQYAMQHGTPWDLAVAAKKGYPPGKKKGWLDEVTVYPAQSVKMMPVSGEPIPSTINSASIPATQVTFTDGQIGGYNTPLMFSDASLEKFYTQSLKVSEEQAAKALLQEKSAMAKPVKDVPKHEALAQKIKEIAQSFEVSISTLAALEIATEVEKHFKTFEVDALKLKLASAQGVNKTLYEKIEILEQQYDQLQHSNEHLIKKLQAKQELVAEGTLLKGKVGHKPWAEVKEKYAEACKEDPWPLDGKITTHWVPNGPPQLDIINERLFFDAPVIVLKQTKTIDMVELAMVGNSKEAEQQLFESIKNDLLFKLNLTATQQHMAILTTPVIMQYKDSATMSIKIEVTAFAADQVVMNGTG